MWVVLTVLVHGMSLFTPSGFAIASEEPSGAERIFRLSVDGAEKVAAADKTAPQAPGSQVGPMLRVAPPCQGAPKGLLCHHSCTGAEGAQLSFCDGQGGCKPAINYSCAPYQCRDGTCLLSCTADQHCATSHVCRSGQCLLRPSYCSDNPSTGAPGNGRYVVTSDRRFINCYPYMCREGDCLERCGSAADCYSGFHCNSAGVCGPGR